MKIKLVGKNLDDIRPLLAQFHLEETDTGFEAVISHGGDGAMLGAEREFPGVPKFPLRDAATAPTCPQHELLRRLESFATGKEKLTRLPKLSGIFQSTEVLAVNDVFLHNFRCSSALRYRVRIDGELYAEEVVGDGVGLSSVHGSSAYYRSITHSLFRVGVGLAFSNSTEEINHLVLDARSVVEIEIVRGPALLVADNSPERIEVPEHGRVQLRQSEQSAPIYGLAEFMCPHCRRLRHPYRLSLGFRFRPV